MKNEGEDNNTVFLLAWTREIGEKRHMFFEHSTARIYRGQSVTHAGIRRGNRSTVVFCDHIHGDDYLTKEELSQIAVCFLDGAFVTEEIDLR